MQKKIVEVKNINCKVMIKLNNIKWVHFLKIYILKDCNTF